MLASRLLRASPRRRFSTTLSPSTLATLNRVSSAGEASQTAALTTTQRMRERYSLLTKDHNLNPIGMYAIYSYLAVAAGYFLTTDNPDPELQDAVTKIRKASNHGKTQSMHSKSTNGKISGILPLTPCDDSLQDALDTIIALNYVTALTNYDTTTHLLNQPDLIAALFTGANESVNETVRGACSEILYTLTTNSNSNCATVVAALSQPAIVKSHATAVARASEYINAVLTAAPTNNQYVNAGYDLLHEAVWTMSFLDNLTAAGSVDVTPTLVNAITTLLNSCYPEVADYLKERRGMWKGLKDSEVSAVVADLDDLFARHYDIFEPRVKDFGENYSGSLFAWNNGFSIDGRALKVIENVSRAHPELLLKNEEVLSLAVALSRSNHELREHARAIADNLLAYMSSRPQEYLALHSVATVLLPPVPKKTFPTLDVATFLKPRAGIEQSGKWHHHFYSKLWNTPHHSFLYTAVMPSRILTDAFDFGLFYGTAATWLDMRMKGEGFASGKLTMGWGKKLEVLAKGGLRTGVTSMGFVGAYLMFEEAYRRLEKGEKGGLLGPFLNETLFYGVFITMCKIDALSLAVRVTRFAALPAFLAIHGQDILMTAGLKREEDGLPIQELDEWE